jgi:hypothetical protein
MTPEEELETALRMVPDRVSLLEQGIDALRRAHSEEQQQRYLHTLENDLRELLAATQTIVRNRRPSPPGWTPPPPAAIRRRAEELGFDPGVYEEIVTVTSTKNSVPIAVLVLNLTVTASEPDSPEPEPETGNGVAAAIIRICCATVVGALIGTPLGALAVQDDIVRKMLEAGVTTAVGTTAAEVIYPISIRLTRRSFEPAEPEPGNTSVLDIFYDETPQGGMPGPDDEGPDIDPPQPPDPGPQPPQPGDKF